MLNWLTHRARLAWQRVQAKPFVTRAAAAKLPTEYGEFDIVAYEDSVDRQTHVALVHGDLGSGENVIVRVHSSCVTGDIFHSARCDCGQQLDTAMRRIVGEGRGVLLYLNQEGRGIGLANKIRAYSLQDEGFDTVEANERLGFAADLREYGVSKRILVDLGIHSVRLLSNNPLKLAGVAGVGLSVSERIPIEIPASDHSRRYLKTKKDKLGHELTSV
jgi:3,4-dihydroxy 2-butanone 4-phosphate synthase/GTP cyclohydrolase II